MFLSGKCKKRGMWYEKNTQSFELRQQIRENDKRDKSGSRKTQCPRPIDVNGGHDNHWFVWLSSRRYHNQTKHLCHLLFLI